MKAFLVGAAIVGVLTPPLIRTASAQDIDAQCKDVYDKVACGCALQNGGRVIPPAVGVKREGLKLRPQEGPTQTLDGGQVAFPKYFRRDGLKVHKSRALEGYLACMRLNGRK
ncbi:MAG TPA: hypothetical protein VEC94_14870 [Pseudolabrys sp.]|nr:hypothetical protein [Pseudolabrys sp.]